MSQSNSAAATITFKMVARFSKRSRPSCSRMHLANSSTTPAAAAATAATNPRAQTATARIPPKQPTSPENRTNDRSKRESVKYEDAKFHPANPATTRDRHADADRRARPQPGPVVLDCAGLRRRSDVGRQDHR